MRKPKASREILLQEYVQSLRQHMLLNDWAVTYDPHDSPDDDDEAQISTNDGLEATLVIHPAFWLKTPEEQREILTHELCHLHTDRTRSTWHRLSDHFRPDVYETFAGVFSDADEHTCQIFTRILAPLLPLPRF